MQGGIHPDYTGQTYIDIVKTVKRAVPEMHVHAFSPLEICHGAETLGVTVAEFLARLKRVGLSSLPGTAAENRQARHYPEDRAETARDVSRM
jgi:FO synthase